MLMSNWQSKWTININDTMKKERKKQNDWLLALKNAKEILNKYQCRYFLDSGTLLGAVRDGKFIEWDNDIDLGVVDFSFDREVLLAISRNFYKKGYNVSTTLTGINVSDVTGQIDLGIKFYERDGDNYMTHLGYLEGSSFFASLSVWTSQDAIHKAGYGSFVKKAVFSNILMSLRWAIPAKMKEWFNKKANVKMAIVKVPKELLQSFIGHPFYDDSFMMPKRREEYLAYRYGSLWMKPNKDYVYYKEDGAICNS